MPLDKDSAALLDVARAARLVLAFKGDMTKDAFTDDYKTQSAIMHQLLIVGEATKRLTQEFRAAHPDIPWTLMAGMRNNLIHAYDSVDLGEVWKTAQDDVPALLKLLEPLLPVEDED